MGRPSGGPGVSGSGPPRARWWNGCLALLLVGLGLAGPAVAGEPIPPGAWDLTLAGGWAVSHPVGGTRAGLTGLHLVPRLGRVVTGLRGPERLRGQLELAAEPVLVHLDTRASTTFLGLDALVRWLFAGRGRWRPYVEAGAGVVGAESGLPGNRCEVSFTLQGGAGVLVFFAPGSAISVGYRFHHLSNGNLCSPNAGVNASVVLVGLTRFWE